MLTWAARHLGFLRVVPGLPHIFNFFLLICTGLLTPKRFQCLQTIEKTLLRWPGVTTRLHKFGGIEFAVETRQGYREIGHLHGTGLLDIPFSKQLHDEVIATNTAIPHHIFPESHWVSFHIETDANMENALKLLHLNYERWQKRDML